MLRSLLPVILLALVAIGTGCSNTLETGYKPRPLGASLAMRRSYYASPFSPEARAPQLEREQEVEARRPRPGY
jgi:hypothetical protein